MMMLKKYSPFAIAVSLGLNGCELIGPELHEKIQLEEVSMHEENPDVIYQELSNIDSESSLSEAAKKQIYPGSGQFTRNIGTPKPAAQQGKGEYSLNFDDADLGEVSKVILTDILNENYVLSPKVAGKVTLQTTQPLSKQELLPTLEMLLQLNNAALTFRDGLYQIKPASEAVVSSFFAGSARRSLHAGQQIKVVPIKNVAVTELLEIIKPLLHEKTVLHADKQRNLLMLSGTASELQRAMDIVNTFDIDLMNGRSFGLFPLQSVEAKMLIEELNKLFSVEGKEGGGIIQFMEIERLNAILAITTQPKKLNSVEQWILRLDRTNTAAGGGVNVYRAQHVDAVELAATLNEIFASSNKQNTPASIAAGKKQVEVTNKKTDTSKTKTKTKTAVKAAAGVISSEVGDVKIIADEINNALIIVATAQDYVTIHRVIKQLDVMPLQVLIDATIVEVSLTDELSYGIRWFLEHNNGGQNAASSGGFDLTSTAASLATGAATGGFGYSFVSNSGDIRAVLDATATDNKLNVISSPSLMVLNNQEASIQVGDEVPIRTSQSTNLNNDSGIETSSIQQRKTGVKLKVKPRVNASGLVIMEIEQSVENVAATTVSGIDSPTIATREITSSVAVPSGETIVLGGLIENDDTFNKSGIPVLHELPLIGPLFGSTTKNNVKTELVVLITPRVIKSRQDARLVANEFKRKLSGIYMENPEQEEVEVVEE